MPDALYSRLLTHSQNISLSSTEAADLVHVDPCTPAGLIFLQLTKRVAAATFHWDRNVSVIFKSKSPADERSVNTPCVQEPGLCSLW